MHRALVPPIVSEWLGLFPWKGKAQMKTGEMIGIGAVIAIMLSLALLIAGPGTKLATTWDYLTSGKVSNQQSIPPSAGSSVVGSPSLTAAKIDQILSNAGSPAVGTGQTFYNDSLTYGIDDSVALAFFHHESGYGTSGAAVDTHNMGNIVCTSGYDCIGRFRAYPSWQAGIDDWYRLIKDVYISQGHTTVESIIPIYAPSSDNNDCSAYISAVETDVQNWKAL
jgi:hypothetical protein